MCVWVSKPKFQNATVKENVKPTPQDVIIAVFTCALTSPNMAATTSHTGKWGNQISINRLAPAGYSR